MTHCVFRVFQISLYYLLLNGDPMNIGKELKRLRTEKNISSIELAKISNVTQSTISEIESNNRSPRVDTLEKLAKGLGVPFVELLPSEVLHVCSSLEDIELLDLIKNLEQEKKQHLKNFLRSISK